MADRFSYVAPARVKVLLVPTRAVQRTEFDRYVRLLRSSASARLADISPISHLKFFNPQTFPQGRIAFDFSVSEPESHSIYLHDFEPFRKTFIIIAVGHFTGSSDDSELDKLRRLYPSAISRNVIHFDTPDETCAQLLSPSDHSLKYSFYHNSHNLTALDTIMCEIARNFLVALDEYAVSYQNITLRSPVSITDSQLLTKRISQAQKRLSSGSSSLKISFAANTSPSDSKARLALKHNGRQLKLLASFYLLAGKYIDALSTFSDALVHLRKAEDYMWMGSALESLSAAVVMLNYAEVPYQLPNATLTSILALSRSKLRDLTSSNADDASLRMSSESLSSGVGNAANKPPALSPRNSTSSGLGLSLQLGGTQDLNNIPVPELIKYTSQKVFHFYQLSANDLENTVPDLVYIESLIRASKFMTSIYLNGPEINQNFYEALVKSEKISFSQVPNPWFTKADILRELDKVFLLQLVDLELVDQCTIYSALAAIFNDLGMHRKRAFILRTLLIGIMPKLDLGISANEKNGGPRKETKSLTERQLLQSSLKDILDVVSECYGFGLQPEGSQGDAFKNAASSWSSLHIAFIKLYIQLLESTHDFGHLLDVYVLVLTRFVHCLPEKIEIEVKEKIEKLLYFVYKNNLGLAVQYWDPFLLRAMMLVQSQNSDELIPFADYLPSQSKSIAIDGPDVSHVNGNVAGSNPVIFDPYNKPSAPNKSSQSQILIKDDVYHLKAYLQNPYSFELEVSDFSVVSDRNNVQTVKSGIKQMPISSVSPALAKLGFKSQKSVMSLQKVKTEPKLGIEKMSGTTLGPADSPKPTPSPDYVDSTSQLSTYTLAPHSIQAFVIPFKASEVGTLLIKGLNIVVGSCAQQLFAVATEELPAAQTKLKCGPKSSIEKPLESVIKNLKENNIKSRVKTMEIELRVIPQQPTLNLLESSINNGWLMLLEGEKYEFNVSLRNQSLEPINFLSFSFWDSTIQTLTKRLETNTIGNRGLSPIDVYEIEWYLLEFKAFRIMNKQEINEKYKPIKPQKDVTIKYEVTGKRGLTSAKIILEYANKLSELSACFMKTVEIPLNFSILPSIELINCDILPLLVSTLNDVSPSVSGDTRGVNKNLAQLNELINSLLQSKDEAISDYCLLLLDLRNSSNEDLKIQVDFQSSPQRMFQIADVLKSGKTTRYLFPVKRVSQVTNDLKKPIPSLRNKQFVKNYQVSEAMEMEMREAFWLRDIILGKINGVWQCDRPQKPRVGSIDFRNIRLNRKMCNIMVFQKVKLVHELLREGEQSTVVQRTGTHYELETEEFYTLRTTITNFSDKAISGILRHVPFPKYNGRGVPKRENLIIDKRILINGLFDTAIDQAIGPSQSLQVDVSLCILERGEYEWGSVLEIADDDQTKVIGREPMYILAL